VIAGVVMKRFWSDQRGAALTEYTILISLITLAVLSLIVSIGGWTTTVWTNLLTVVNL
jgi:pilus assembly protein Flp/PilA